MRIPYGRAAYERSNFPDIRLVNMYAEASPVGRDGVAIISRKGLLLSSTAGSGPVTGGFCEANVFNGDKFWLSGGTLYRGSTSLGAIIGSGPVSFAAGSASELAICAGGPIYRYDGSTLVAVTFPDSANVTKIVFHDGLYLAARALTHKWYWSSVLDADTWASLDFLSAESRPDTLLDMAILGDALFLFGENTIEPWSNTGDPDAPYSRVEDRIVQHGILATGGVQALDNSLLYPGSDGVVYRWGDVPQRISDHGLEEKIAQCMAASGTVSAFSFTDNGHSFYCLRLTAGDGQGTHAYDVATSTWTEFATYNRDNFAGQCAVNDGLTVYLGDDSAGTIWTLDGWEDNSDILERLFTIATPLDGGTLTIDNLTLEANSGATEVLSGQGVTPLVELRTSRDAGKTFGGWASAALGASGNYATKTQWRRVGTFAVPGFLGEVRCTDPVAFRCSGVFANERGGGRSR